MKRILVISFSDLARDPRVDRQLGILGERYEVVAAGLGPPAEAGVRFIDLRIDAASGPAEVYRRARSLLRLLGGRYDTVYWSHPLNRAAAEHLSAIDADLVIANDLSALPLATRVAGDAPIVFDAHELATEEHGHRLWWRLIMAPYADALLRSYLPPVTAMTTVSAGIADVYRGEYGSDPTVLTNAPPRAALSPTGVGSTIRMIHHGVPFRERRLELMVDAVRQLDDRYELDLMLVPGHARYAERLSKRIVGTERVRLIPPVPQRAVVTACNQYDVGLAFFPPSNENLRHVLPNKLFEFIQARLAIAIGPSPEMVKVVDAYDCGVIAADFTADALAEALSTLTPERIMEMKHGSDVAADDHNSEHNAEILLAIVDRALGRSTTR